MMKCEDIPYFISLLVSRPVRWAPPEQCVGDRTLQVFNADVNDQRKLLRLIRSKQSLWGDRSGEVVVIFYSVAQSNERYAEFLEQWFNTSDDRKEAEFWSRHSVEEFADQLEEVVEKEKKP